MRRAFPVQSSSGIVGIEPARRMVQPGMKPLILSFLVILAAPAAAQTLADVQARSDREFAAADANGDGVVTREEMTRRIMQRYGTVRQGRGITVQQAGMVTDRFFGEMDADGDGRVTRAEARRVTEASFRRLDANGNGRIDPDERRDARALLLGLDR